jgi:hypothetical protein
MKLQDLDTTMVQDDIRKYLTSAFADVRNTRTECDLRDWPEPSAIDSLVESAGTLFVYASTAVRFVEDRYDSPRDRLELLMGHHSDSESASPYDQLDQLYTEVLTNTIQASGNNRDRLSQRMRNVLVVIILAQHPLSVAALAALSGYKPDVTSIVVQSLSALLLVDAQQPVRVFHPSLPDFIISSDRCKDARFLITPSTDHQTLVRHCLNVMDELCYNICGLADPSQANADVDGLAELLNAKVSEALRYAMAYWLFHISKSGEPDSNLVKVLSHFSRRHLFHWIELLSLTGSLSFAYKGLPEAEAWCEVCCRPGSMML